MRRQFARLAIRSHGDVRETRLGDLDRDLLVGVPLRVNLDRHGDRRATDLFDRRIERHQVADEHWLLLSLRTEHGAYSEVFIHSPVGNGIGRLIVDPYSLLLFSSRAEDFTAINEKRAAGLSVSQAIDAVIRDRSRR